MGNAHTSHIDHHRKHSTGPGPGGDGFVFGNDKSQFGNRENSPYEPTGPVDVLSPNQTTPSRIAPAAPPANRAHRPRATTESGPRRHITINYPDHFGSENDKNGLSTSLGKTLSPTGENEKKKRPTIIKYSGQGKEVYVCGTFNEWQKMKMSRSQKDFVAMVELGEGNHEYKFFVDGQWLTDPNIPTIENGTGFKNHVIHVEKGDFDAFEALDMDMASVSKAQSHKARASMKPQPQTQYGQEMPHVHESSSLTEHPPKSSGPPILPPHLLQVILNKDTPMSCEPTLLPEPNHVMLNHLYALSIKDGVMVLSTTQRFKKKYVTTLLYKPMGTRTPDEQ